ncbi:MAG: tetratricopeptide repeat protein [Rhodothermales bacterium]|nr:tetratricopeptide repeat protein [Rhodothermales bacterium]MBO6778188.1 tetratricopeptide repeat protein [Rhodothermales bacterium]
MTRLLFLVALLVGCAPADPSVSDVPVVTAAYTGDTACASCHEDQYASFQSHGMANSFYAMHPERVIEDFPGPAVYHEESDFYYRAFREGDRFFQEEYRLDDRGTQTHRLVRPITHVVGSAQAARTYVSHVNGRYFELPLTWYAQEGIWDFSPGYAEANQRFDRKVTARCMACHTDAPPRAQGLDDVFGAQPAAISCERCHGPGSEHVAARRAVPNPPEGGDPTLVRLASLSMDRRLDVCQQCHLNGAVVTYPDGKDPYSFRPGDALSDHQVLYAAAHDQGFSVVSHADRLKQSACFLESLSTQRPLECTTCHDPHDGFRDQGPAYFDATCQSCHTGVAQEVAPELQGAHQEAVGCVDCHMSRREVENAPHSTFTDHFIRASAPVEESVSGQNVEGVVLQPLEGEASAGEEALAYLTYGFGRGDMDAIARGLILAESERDWFLQEENSEAALTWGKALLLAGRQGAVEPMRAAARADTTDAERLHGVARALEADGDFDTALSFYERALTYTPGSVRILSDYGNLLQRLSRLGEAEEAYRKAIAEEPWDAASHNGLAVTLMAAGRLDESIAAARDAVALNPDYVDGLTNLGTALARSGQLEESLEVLRKASLLGYEQGNLAPVLNLGLVALQTGNHEEAVNMIGRVVVANPDNTDMRVLLARAFIGKGDPISAMAQLNAGLRANPGHPAATALKEELESRN